MNVNSINNTNFRGMYKIPFTDENIKQLKEFVLPTYSQVSNEHVVVFSGNNPFRIGLANIMNSIAEKNKSSIEWLKMNAKNYGMDVPVEDEVLHIISTTKDINKLYEYMAKRVESRKPTLMNKIKNFFGIKEVQRYDGNLPEHLILLSEALKYDSQETVAFKEYSKGIKELNTPLELFKAMMKER